MDLLFKDDRPASCVLKYLDIPQHTVCYICGDLSSYVPLTGKPINLSTALTYVNVLLGIVPEKDPFILSPRVKAFLVGQLLEESSVAVCVLM